MKPQCTTAAQCLKELARVMEQFGIADMFEAVDSKYVKQLELTSAFPYYPHSWQFAIAEVEGKPVFIGDELYDSFGTGYIADYGLRFDLLSWNPPKPKTVMVEVSYQTAVHAANWNRHDNMWLCEIGTACKLALEKLK